MFYVYVMVRAMLVGAMLLVGAMMMLLVGAMLMLLVGTMLMLLVGAMLMMLGRAMLGRAAAAAAIMWADPTNV